MSQVSFDSSPNLHDLQSGFWVIATSQNDGTPASKRIIAGHHTKMRASPSSSAGQRSLTAMGKIRYIALLACCEKYREGSGFDDLPGTTEAIKELATLLRSFDYQIHCCYGATKDKMNFIMESMLQDLEAGVETVLLVCFSGHGLNLHGKQYLAGVDAVKNDEKTLVRLDEWIENLQSITSPRGANRRSIAEKLGAEIVPDCTTIVLLDCCRSFIYEKPVQPRRGDSSIAVLGVCDADEAAKCAVVYPCDEGHPSYGSSNEASHFLAAFIEVAKEGEGMKLSTFVQRLSDRVRKLSLCFQRVDIHYKGIDEVASSVVLFRDASGGDTHDSAMHLAESQLKQVEQYHSRAIVFFIVTHLLNGVATILWLSGFIQKEWSTRAFLVPHVIATVSASFTAHQESPLHRKWFAVERGQYCVFFPSYFIMRALGEWLRDNDFDRSLMTLVLAIMTCVSTLCFQGLLRLWRESTFVVDGKHLFGAQVWDVTNLMTMPCMLISCLHLFRSVESVTSAHLEMIHAILMIGCLISLHLAFCFELVMQPFSWARDHLSQFCTYDNGYLLSCLLALLAALVYADSSGLVLSSLSQTLWMAKYFLFFLRSCNSLFNGVWSWVVFRDSLYGTTAPRRAGLKVLRAHSLGRIAFEDVAACFCCLILSRDNLGV